VETGGDSIEIGSVGGDLKLETGGAIFHQIGERKNSRRDPAAAMWLCFPGEQGAVIEAGGGNVDIKRCMGGGEGSTGGGNNQSW